MRSSLLLSFLAIGCSGGGQYYPPLGDFAGAGDGPLPVGDGPAADLAGGDAATGDGAAADLAASSADLAAAGDGAPATCANGMKDGDETDVDCGGAVCATRCDTGKGCVRGADCAS